ncbi:unnamed protein product [Ilex paraguariensis]|uniref:Uncharacterized protein n=1 Tax=Ilex paraguariensis TaxID=185542 RepID=A0ABC8T2I9_9AQUA
MGKDLADASMARLPRNVRNSSSRRRRNCRILEIQGSDENEDEHAQDGNKASSSTDDCETEIKQTRSKRHTRAWSSQPSSAANSGDGCVENERECSRENRDSPGLLCTPEKLAWGRGGTRSQTRHGSAIGSKGTRSTRLSKLVNYLQGLQEKDDEYVAHKTSLPANDVEMLLLEETQNINPSTSLDDTNPPSQVGGHCKDGQQSLEGQEQVGDLKAIATSSKDHLILAYRLKEAN